MNSRVTSIIEDARNLTPEEREELLLRLQAEFDAEGADGTPEEIAAAWAEELEKRIAQIDRGEATWRTHDEVMEGLRKLIRDA